jgi:hypothetical protein
LDKKRHYIAKPSATARSKARASRSVTVRVLATLRQCLREGTPWRSLKATTGQASGSTLRRHLEQWANIGLLVQVHAVLVGMLRGDPTLILDSCSARAKRGGDLTGPNPTDRGQRGTKYHIGCLSSVLYGVSAAHHRMPSSAFHAKCGRATFLATPPMGHGLSDSSRTTHAACANE